jgi:hypothetical protein
MAGHRLRKAAATGQPPMPLQSVRRKDVQARRLAYASTPAERAAAAWDNLRAVCKRNPGRAAAALEEAARQLDGLAKWVTESRG